jgi:hypothetical protein
MKINIRVVLENLPKRFIYYKNLTNVTNTVHKDQCTFVTIPRSVRLRMRNVPDKVVEKINTYVACFLLSDSPASEFYKPAFRNTLSVPPSYLLAYEDGTDRVFRNVGL